VSVLLCSDFALASSTRIGHWWTQDACADDPRGAMLHVVQPCDIAVDSNVSNNWGFGLVVVFAVFLFSELGLTTWNLMRRVEAGVSKKSE
jgi:hypothetical protein